MTSPVLNEAYYTAAFLVSEARGLLSRDAGVIANAGGSDLQLAGGLVVALNDEGTITASKLSGTGNGTIGAVTLGPDAKVGTYRLTCIAAAANAGSFSVVNPNGDRLADLAVGVAYASTEINLTVNDGATDWAAGDVITVVIAAGDGKWAPFTNASGQDKLGILFNRVTVPAGGSAKVTIIRRQAEVNAGELVWDASLSGGTLTAAKAAAAPLLAAAGIIQR